MEGVDYGTIPYSSLSDGQKQSYLSAKAYIARQNAAPAATATTPDQQQGPVYGPATPLLPGVQSVLDAGRTAWDWFSGSNTGMGPSARY